MARWPYGLERPWEVCPPNAQAVFNRLVALDPIWAAVFANTVRFGGVPTMPSIPTRQTFADEEALLAFIAASFASNQEGIRRHPDGMWTGTFNEGEH